ncbi:hypothetical protein ACWDUL_20970 [Nocardia niigatensis]
MSAGPVPTHALLSGLRYWRLITAEQVGAIGVELSAALARHPDLYRIPDPVPDNGFRPEELATDLHPIAVAAIADRVLEHLHPGPLRTRIERLRHCVHAELPAADLAPLPVPGADRGRPAYRHSPIYRGVPPRYLTDLAQIPRRGTDPELVVAPADFAAAPDLIRYRPLQPGTAQLSCLPSALAHLRLLQRLCDHHHAGSRTAAGSDRWAASFAALADPLIAALDNRNHSWHHGIEASHLEMVVAALARREVLPVPAPELVRTPARLHTWTATRMSTADYVIIEPTGILTRHHRHQHASLGSHIGTHLRGPLTTSSGPTARLWHRQATGRAPNPPATYLAAALAIPTPPGVLHGPVAMSMATSDDTGRLPALTPELTRILNGHLARWRHHQHPLPSPADAATTLTRLWQHDHDDELDPHALTDAEHAAIDRIHTTLTATHTPIGPYALHPEPPPGLNTSINCSPGLDGP